MDSILKTRLFQSYCLGFCGEVLLHLSSRQIKALEVSYDNIIAAFGHSLMYHILLLLTWLLSLSV